MTIIHQAIFGDKEGSYALLKTSLPDDELARRICNVTDLLDRPSNGKLTQPVFRGFRYNDSYIFIRSFPDNDPLVRTGRVLSHTLIVEQDDLYQLNDLDKLFPYFLSKPDKDPKLNLIVLDDEDAVSNKIVNQTSREAAGINGLLDHSSYSNTVVWLGEEGYIPFIAKIWRQLEGNLRMKLNLGVSFSPKKSETNKLNIFYVMEGYESKWKVSDYYIVRKEDTGTLESMSSFLLAGHRNKCEPLKKLIQTFGIVPAEIEDFRYLETGIATYKNLSTKTEFNRLIVFCDLINQYSPDPNIAKVEKDKLLTHVTSKIASATTTQILTLKNTGWKGFLSAQQIIGDQLASWVVKSLFDSTVDESTTSLVAAAFDPKNDAEWWKKAFSRGLEAELKNWKSTHAPLLLSWFSVDHNLVKTLKDLIPENTQVESDFVDHWQKPESELAQNIQVFAKDRKWLSIYGLSTLQLFSPEESIKRQLEIDIDPEHSVALNRMDELIPDREFLRLTVKIGESRLVKIAGEKVVRIPSLISQLDQKNIIWREILFEGIEQGMQLCDAFKEPAKVLFLLFEELVNGVEIEPNLFLKFSESGYNDISSFKHRSDVWSHLDETVKHSFISATTLGCVRFLDKKDIDINDLEDDILVCLSNADIINQIIRDKTINVSTKLLLFKELPIFKENELLGFLNSVRFSKVESKCIGELIFRNHWNKAAEYIAINITTREDLKPALKECQSFLGFFERVRLSILGLLSETVSTEEWWFAFLEQCYTKYPKGPADKGLWGRANGKNYDLLATGTGREIWVDIIAKIQNGKIDVDIQKLLYEMIKDYPSSNELEQINRTIGIYGD